MQHKCSLDMKFTMHMLNEMATYSYVLCRSLKYKLNKHICTIYCTKGFANFHELHYFGKIC